MNGRRPRRWLQAVRWANAHNSGLPLDAAAVSFFPMRPEPTATLAHVLARLGIRVAAFGAPAQLTIAWDTGTWLADLDMRRLPRDAINRACVDVSKLTVDVAWAKTSGHSITVDPLWTTGALVSGPERHGARSRVLEGPLRDRRPDHVYRKLIDSSDGDLIWSMGVALLCGRIVNAFVRSRPVPHWFRGGEVTVPIGINELFSSDEQHQLVEFAEEIGMEYGELDVLREKESGLIYVVDANRTPARLEGLHERHDDAWFGPITDAFAELLRDRTKTVR